MSEPLRPALRIAVVGAAEATTEERDTARDVGSCLAAAGAIVVCGGRGGVMEAAARGAAEHGGISVGLLPGNEGTEANPWVSIPLATGIGEARNAIVVRAAEAVIAVGGAWGTLSEIALAAKMGRPVTSVGRAPKGVEGVHESPDADTAVEWALARAAEGRNGTL